MAYGNTFRRREVKYILDANKYSEVRNAISGHMTEEIYGKYTICNIYCDSPDSELIRESLEKPVYKEKLRLRTYGTASDGGDSFLEIKKKYNGVVYKRRVQLPYLEALRYIRDGVPPEQRSQVINEVDYMIKRHSLAPKLIICYDRRAFFGNDNREFRLTFDSGIRSRTEDLDLRSGDYGETLAEQPFRLMELKVTGAMPMWMTEILSSLELYPVSFSKYGSIYAAGIKNNGSFDVCSQVS